MGQLETYLILFGIIVIIGQIFSKSPIPISLILVITGMLLSLWPSFPIVNLNPTLVLNVFLPLLVYQISAYASWKDLKKNMRPIGLLSVGHVLFITVLIAWVIHFYIPQLGWPLAFVLGAVLSPPDSVAIVTIAEKIRMPTRVVSILEGEGLLNDATALILFRFALVAMVTHEFSAMQAVSNFFMIIIGETLYGLILGYVIAELRLRIRNSMLNILASILTPFLAYLPAEHLGGSGVLATVVTGFMIGHVYGMRFTPEFRLVSRAVWPAISFGIQGILFLLVGLDFHAILSGISSISLNSLILYSAAVILTVILGRFIWVYIFLIFLPRFLFPSILKKDPYPPWQFPFIISWSGMRGGISLAAALAVPFLPGTVEGANPRDLLIFLVFCAITATFVIQGLTLPWLLKKLGINKYGQSEKYTEHLSEISAKMAMTKAVLRWLAEYKDQIKDNQKLLDETKLHIRQYRMIKLQLKEKLQSHHENLIHDEKTEKAEILEETFILSQLIEVERAELLQLWKKEKINLAVRDKLLTRLDHRSNHLVE